jgi:prolyl oligopeptidase
MQIRRLVLIGIVFSFSLPAVAQKVPPLPATPKKPVTEEYHGVKVTDDYRWLEDNKSPEVIAWTQAENAHARAVLDPLPVRSQIQQFFKTLIATSSPAYFALQIAGEFCSP